MQNIDQENVNETNLLFIVFEYIYVLAQSEIRLVCIYTKVFYVIKYT